VRAQAGAGILLARGTGLNAVQCSIMKTKMAMTLAAVSVLVSACAEIDRQTGNQNVSAQDPFYMIVGNVPAPTPSLTRCNAPDATP
jgi:hypothetical protein